MKVVVYSGKVGPELRAEQERMWNGIPDPVLDKFFREQDRKAAEARRLRTQSQQGKTSRQQDK